MNVAVAAKPNFPAALLIPQSGEYAALGRSMERAARLAQGAGDEKAVMIFDTGGTVDGAQNAARQAMRDGATIILGPVFSKEVTGVLATTKGQLPVLSFSNDLALRESGAFLLGLTADQATRAILGYAAGRGIRRVAVGGSADGWGGQVRSAANAVAPSTGVVVTALPEGDLQVLPPIAGSADGLPDAVLMPDAAGLARLAPALAGTGVQALGAFSDIDMSAGVVGQLEGAWVSAPDIANFSDFASAYERRMGSRPGLLAGLAYDAVRIVETMRLGGGTDRSALLSIPRFKGVCGDVRFREDGSAARSMSILQLTGGQIRTIGTGTTL